VSTMPTRHPQPRSYLSVGKKFKMLKCSNNLTHHTPCSYPVAYRGLQKYLNSMRRSGLSVSMGDCLERSQYGAWRMEVAQELNSKKNII